MIKLTGTVVNNNLKLIGLAFKGSPKDFGEVSMEKELVKLVELNKCAPFINSSSNYKMVGNVITAINGRDTLSQLDMYNMSGVQIPNGVALTKRILSDDKLLGFDLDFEYGDKKRFKYDHVVTLSQWFKPLNYMIRTRNDKSFIAGKGMTLNDLPSENLGGNKDNKKSKVTRDISHGDRRDIDVNKVNDLGKTNLDLFDLFDTIRHENGYILSLGEYKKTIHSDVEVAEEFTKLGGLLTGIAKPYISHSSNKMKANASFKSPGYVTLDDGSQIMSYTYNDRTMLINGTNNMKNIGIAVPEDGFEGVLNHIKSSGGLIKYKEMTDANAIKATKALTGNIKNEMKFIQLDLSGMKVMSEERANRSILENEQVAKAVLKIEMNKIVSKAVRPVLKEINARIGVKEEKVADMFKMYSPEMILKLKESFIDTSTGAYLGITDKPKSVGAKKEDKSILVEYTVLPSTIGSKKAVLLWEEGSKGRIKAIDSRINEIKNDFEALSEDIDKANFLSGVVKDNDDNNNLINKALWMHKMAMLQNNNMREIHVKDGDKWVVKANRSKVKVNTYKTDIGKLTLNIKTSDGVIIPNAVK